MKRSVRQSRLAIERQLESDIRLRFVKLKSVNNPNSIHGIYPYRGKISAVDAQQIIRQLPQKGTLLDPFCGSGTIVYEAQDWGLDAAGIDSNPLAVTLTLAKTQENCVEETIHNSRRLLTRAKDAHHVKEMPKWSAKYFHPVTAREVMSMFMFAEEMSVYEEAILYGATCLTARACNHYMWSSNAVGKIIKPLKYVNFYEKYLLKLKKHAKYLNRGRPATVVAGDSRHLSHILEPDSVDIVYTSPPYFDALDYTSYYARIIYTIEERDIGGIREGLIQNVKDYESNMRTILKEIRKVTRANALVIFVVGDKKLKDGQVINGGEFFSRVSDWKPTYIQERKYSGSSSQIWDRINRTERKEQIVVWTT